MTYNVFGGTLNPTLLLTVISLTVISVEFSINCFNASARKYLWSDIVELLSRLWNNIYILTLKPIHIAMTRWDSSCMSNVKWFGDTTQLQFWSILATSCYLNVMLNSCSCHILDISHEFIVTGNLLQKMITDLFFSIHWRCMLYFNISEVRCTGYR